MFLGSESLNNQETRLHYVITSLRPLDASKIVFLSYRFVPAMLDRVQQVKVVNRISNTFTFNLVKFLIVHHMGPELFNVHVWNLFFYFYAKPGSKKKSAPLFFSLPSCRFAARDCGY